MFFNLFKDIFINDFNIHREYTHNIDRDTTLLRVDICWHNTSLLVLAIVGHDCRLPLMLVYFNIF